MMVSLFNRPFSINPCVPASLRPELPSADPCNAGNLLHLFLQDAAHLKDAAGENQPASGGQWPLGIWENGGWRQLHIKLHIYIHMGYKDMG
jgi:hypothetical protein